MPQLLIRFTSFSFSDAAEKASATVLETRRFRQKNLKSDGHLITEDSVLPTTAPGGAPERNRCYQTPAYLFVLPLAPASLARSAHLAPLTSLRPRWGLAHTCYYAGIANPNFLVFSLDDTRKHQFVSTEPNF